MITHLFRRVFSNERSTKMKALNSNLTNHQTHREKQESMKTELNHILTQHQDYLEQRGGNIPLSVRIEGLKRLKETIKKYEVDLQEALKIDLGKNEFEAYSTEIGFIYASIDYTLKRLKKWARPKRVKSEAAQLIGTSLIIPSAYGVVLIIGPFNYPVQLLLEPLIGAIAGGNVAVLKPSEFTPHVESVMVRLIKEAFDSRYVSVVTGDYQVNQALLDLRFDYIFFTGSVKVGKIVMEKASHHLTPLTLELGGKSPVIVDETANLKLAAKRIAWGKFMNAGQTCVAPDYVMVHHSVYEAFLKELQTVIKSFYGDNIQSNPEFGRIVTTRHASRLADLIEGNRDQVVMGGAVDLEDRFIEPTVFKEVTLTSSLMEDELFGPLLPTMSYQSMDEIKRCLKAHPNPLAFYVFSENKAFSHQLITQFSFGGGCINDTITHVASSRLPFGGVGSSGMGRYHGEASFKTFTYEKSMVNRSTKIHLNLVFPPYKDKLKLIKKIMK